MFTEEMINELIELLIKYDKSKIYLGCDSVRFKKNKQWWARYATVCIVHINGCHGCKIFSIKSVERDFDKSDKMKEYRPKMRMLKEVQNTVELYQQLEPFIRDMEIEIHLDISSDPKFKSNVAASEAAGYVLGMTGLQPKLKPNSWASSFGADAVVNKTAFA